MKKKQNKTQMMLWKNLAQILLVHKLHELERYIISIMHVNLSNDSSKLDVYISSIPHDIKVIELLQSNKHIYRTLLAQSTRGYTVPSLIFRAYYA